MYIDRHVKYPLASSYFN